MARPDWAGHWLSTYCDSYANAVKIGLLHAALQQCLEQVAEHARDLEQTRQLLAICVNKLGDRVAVSEKALRKIHGMHLHMQLDQRRKLAILEMVSDCQECED